MRQDEVNGVKQEAVFACLLVVKSLSVLSREGVNAMQQHLTCQIRHLHSLSPLYSLRRMTVFEARCCVLPVQYSSLFYLWFAMTFSYFFYLTNKTPTETSCNRSIPFFWSAGESVDISPTLYLAVPVLLWSTAPVVNKIHQKLQYNIPRTMYAL